MLRRKGRGKSTKIRPASPKWQDFFFGDSRSDRPWRTIAFKEMTLALVLSLSASDRRPTPADVGCALRTGFGARGAPYIEIFSAYSRFDTGDT